MEYDKLGRPLKVTDVDVGDNALSTADSSRREMVYDDVGNVLFVKEFRPANATILTMQAARTYDHLNRVKTFTVTGNTDARLNYTLLWTYLDPLNGYILTYPDGKTVRYDLDNRGRLASVTDWANRKTIYGYDGLGRPSSIDHANNTHRRLDYDAASQLKSIRELDKLGRLIALTQFTDYWPNGQVKGMFTAPKAKTISYHESRLRCVFKSRYSVPICLPTNGINSHSGTGRLFFSNHSILSNRVSRFAFLNWIAVSDKVRLTVTELNSIVSLHTGLANPILNRNSATFLFSNSLNSSFNMCLWVISVCR